MNTTRRRLIAAAALACAGTALAADFPAGTVRLVHGIPGGAVDAGVRVLAEQLGPKWGQTPLVEGKPGASEMLAAEAVARAPKDGLTLLIASEAALVNNDLLFKKPLIDAQRDLVPVCELFEIPFALVVRAGLDVNTLEAFIALMKKEGRQRNYASSGIGSPLQLAMEGLARSAGFEMLHVPYKTIAQLAQDLMGGQIDAVFLGAATAASLAASGKVKLLAVTSAQRSPAAPQVPTFTELGLPGVDYRTTIGLMAPRGTPAAVLARIETDVRQVLASPEFSARFLKPQAVKAGNADAKQLAALLAERRVATQRLIRELDIKPE